MVHSINDVDFSGKRALVRVDFNVPLDENLKVTDDNRIVETLPTIDKIIDDGGIPVLMSHLGRPKGEVNPKYSLEPVAKHLDNVYGYKVLFASDCIGQVAEDIVNKAVPGEIVLLENLRFHKEEEKNNAEFAQKLARLGDVYVNDAFGTAHRAHASCEAVAKLFEHRFAGFLMIKEVEYLGDAIAEPRHPFTVVIGGAKITGKIDVIENLMNRCDYILIGGGMSFTFFKAMGLEVGKSMLEADRVQLASDLIEEAKSKNVELVLPADIIIADSFSNDANFKCVKYNEILPDWYGMDIGPETLKHYEDILYKSRTIVWNGPMGVFEFENFSKGTTMVAQELAGATARGAVTIVGGGDSVVAVNNLNLKSKITHVSTGGGASLEYLEGKTLPGIAALYD